MQCAGAATRWQHDASRRLRPPLLPLGEKQTEDQGGFIWGKMPTDAEKRKLEDANEDTEGEMSFFLE